MSLVAPTPTSMNSAPAARRTGDIPWPALLAMSDAVVLAVAFIVAHLVRFDDIHGGADLVLAGAVVPYWQVSLGCIGIWWLLLLGFKTREALILGRGDLEYTRVLSACAAAAATIAATAYLLDTELARGYLAIAVPTGTILLVASRKALRKFLLVRRAWGRDLAPALVVGASDSAREMIAHLASDPGCGIAVAGEVVIDLDPAGPPLTDAIPAIVRCASERGVHVAVLTDDLVADARRAQMLIWELEQIGVETMVAPALVGVDQTRVRPRVVGHLPLQHISLPDRAGIHMHLKRAMDIVGASLVLVLSSPLLILAALAIKATSPGPVLFRQRRVGRHGATFSILKLRTMCDDAESLRPLLAQNDAAGPLFKLHDDPRVTTVGRFLRRYSIDELPQMINVLRGQMSLVGPRPGLPAEVLEYERHEARRLLVRPGVTGL